MVTLSPMRGMIGGSGAADFFWDFAINSALSFQAPGGPLVAMRRI